MFFFLQLCVRTIWPQTFHVKIILHSFHEEKFQSLPEIVVVFVVCIVL